MEGLTAFLQPFVDLLRPCAEFLIWIFPLKIYRLHDGQRGVIKTFGQVCSWRKPEKGPGVWVCLVFEEMDVIQAIGGYIDLSEQALTTKDQRVILVQSAIEYDVFSVKLAMLETEDIEMLVTGVTMNEIREYGRKKNIDDLIDSDKITSNLCTIINRRLKKNGVEVQRVMITDLRPHETTYVCDKIEEMGFKMIEKIKKGD